jgi:hypothetical protein
MDLPELKMSLFIIDIEQVTHQVGTLGLFLVEMKVHPGVGISMSLQEKANISSTA